MNNLNKEIENRGFNVGDRVQVDVDDDRVWVICDVYPNADDLDASEALEPGDGLSTGALRYDVATFENGDRNDFEVMNVDHNEVSFHSKATRESLIFVIFVEEVHREYK